MSAALYTREILRLAVSIPHQSRLDKADGTAEVRSRACGSRVAADILLSDDRKIAKLGIEVNACALGQASAAILATEAVSKSADEIADTRQQLAGFLEGVNDSPGDWANMEHLMAAKEHKGRHAAILLPYDAILAAFKAATSASEAA
ncbi:iron-sulfur cluster assembly scaffold protein [Parasphingorhabdus cellanae]|uniref:Iron-sulfur cluster assembly scaffold protein n=1 Tax=Parasphingorhabdus cellanae TaxID=2806553 RepID=A0ABX7T971_9SPHN|nr:iron-sulfur cluster assembly scaffold protein [Parasphingorhabdus cellanae]QTD57107.1 iron-sulfur cluster assembly scaffold protein [Parasphingorhabdus cellanae]